MPDFLDSPADADRAVVAAYAAEFDRLEHDWRTIETKAQGTIAVAGLFIGFGLNFSKDVQPDAAIVLKALALVTLLLLVATVVVAASALIVRTMHSPPSPAHLQEYAADYFALPEPRREEARPKLRENLRESWREVVANREVINRKKALCVLWAQGILLFAVVFAASLAGASLFKTMGTPQPPLEAEVQHEVREGGMPE